MPPGSARTSVASAFVASALLVVVAACSAPAAETAPAGQLSVEPSPEPSPEQSPDVSPSPSEPTPTTSSLPETSTPTPPGAHRPEWLGTRVLPERPDGLGEVLDTPPELVDRRFPPPDARPVADGFSASAGPVPDEVLARSTWELACPVELADLSYLTMTFWGFDDNTYVGEMIVNASVANDVIGAFERLYDARFPIEEMRVVDAPELDAPPTGDGNNTTAFVCRPTTLSDSWSEHAYGLAIDVNPFHNPYLRGDAVLPELASAYLDRDRELPGMITQGDAATEAFADIGWGWGGEWTSLKDWMHFSASGR